MVPVSRNDTLCCAPCTGNQQPTLPCKLSIWLLSSKKVLWIDVLKWHNLDLTHILLLKNRGTTTQTPIHQESHHAQCLPGVLLDYNQHVGLILIITPYFCKSAICQFPSKSHSPLSTRDITTSHCCHAIIPNIVAPFCPADTPLPPLLGSQSLPASHQCSSEFNQ
jgi:hypothetical protein